MVVTIEDRRVTSFPIELLSTLRGAEPFCVGCKKAAASVSTCSGCKLVTYCSKECQKKDYKRHKTEDECAAIRKLRKDLEAIEATIEANGGMLMQEVLMKFTGEEDPWLGRGEPSMMEMMGLMALPDMESDEHSNLERTVMDVIAGRFFTLQYTREYMDCIVALNGKNIRVAHHHNLMVAYEEGLRQTVELKRLTHAVHPDMCDRDLPKVLLKLHRDDDAIAFIRYWLKWRSRGPGNLRDPLILLSTKGEWPFPVEEGCRLLDITDELRNCEFQEGDHFSGLDDEDMDIPAPFCLVALAIKIRHITVHFYRLSQTRAFREINVPLPEDIITGISSFLSGGDEFNALCAEQLGHANRLMDLIDEKYPSILKGTLDPRLLPAPRPGKDHVDDDEAYDVRAFMSTFGCGLPAHVVLKEILEDRYDIGSYCITCAGKCGSDGTPCRGHS